MIVKIAARCIHDKVRPLTPNLLIGASLRQRFREAEKLSRSDRDDEGRETTGAFQIAGLTRLSGDHPRQVD